MDQPLWEDIQQILGIHHTNALKEMAALCAEHTALNMTKGNSAQPEDTISPYLAEDMDALPCSRQANSTEIMSPSTPPQRASSALASPQRIKSLQDMKDVLDSCNESPLNELQNHLQHFISWKTCCNFSSPKSRTTINLEKLVTSRYFEWCIMLAILSNFCYTIFRHKLEDAKEN